MKKFFLAIFVVLFSLNLVAQDTKNETGNTTPTVKPEQYPEYPGGANALSSHIAKNMVYPKSAADNGIQGRVFIRFVVTETGAVDKVEVLKGVDPLLDKEAVRVVKTLKDFKPGLKNGKPVAVSYTLPIAFNLQ